MPKTRSEAEAWLLADEPVCGVLAWDREPVMRLKASPHVRATALALVSGAHATSRRRARVEALLLKLEKLEGQRRTTSARVGGT